MTSSIYIIVYTVKKAMIYDMKEGGGRCGSDDLLRVARVGPADRGDFPFVRDCS